MNEIARGTWGDYGARLNVAVTDCIGAQNTLDATTNPLCRKHASRDVLASFEKVLDLLTDKNAYGISAETVAKIAVYSFEVGRLCDIYNSQDTFDFFIKSMEKVGNPFKILDNETTSEQTC